MSLKLNKNLKRLRKEANRFERTDINNKIDESFRAKYSFKLIFSICSAVLVFLLKNGFSESFISYVSSVLSILVGLFITALIFSFDKFYKPSNENFQNSQNKVWDTQAYNYSKKFAFITSYTIVLSIFAIVLLAFNALFEIETKVNIYNYTFCLKCIIIKTWDSFCIFFQVILLITQRFLVLYWLMKIMYNTLYIVSSMVQFMTTKIDRQ